MTVKCLAQLKASTVGEFEILLWINGDANAEYNHPLIESHDLVRGTDERLGLAAAYNRAVHHLRGDLFCVIHNDCFVNPGWNKSLEEEALRGNIAFPIVTTNAGFLAASARMNWKFSGDGTNALSSATSRTWTCSKEQPKRE